MPSATERRWKLRHDGTEADDATAANGANGTSTNGGGSHGAAPPLLSAEDTSTALVWAANHLPGFAPAHSPCETKVDGRHRAVLLGTVAAQQPNGGDGDACGEAEPGGFAAVASYFCDKPVVVRAGRCELRAVSVDRDADGGCVVRWADGETSVEQPADLGSTRRTARPTATRRAGVAGAPDGGGAAGRSSMATRARRSLRRQRGGLTAPR